MKRGGRGGFFMHQICLYPLDAPHSEIRIFLKTLRIVVVANYLLLVLVEFEGSGNSYPI